MMILHLHLDFETRSPLDIRSVGLDRYSRTANVLMMAWAINDQIPQLWLPDTGPMPDLPRGLLTRPEVIKIAWNAAFERAILRHCLDIESPVEQWIDSAIMARYAGMPHKLAEVSEFLGLGSEGKDKDGARLMRKFSFPRKDPAKGPRMPQDEHPDTRYTQPTDAPEDWLKYQAYCRQDVVAERAAMHKLQKAFSLPAREVKLWHLDAAINERGLPVDMEHVAAGQAIVLSERQRVFLRLRELTNLDNPNSVKQLLGWLRSAGYPYSSLGAKKVIRALPGAPDAVREVLLLRQQGAKSSVAKLETLAARVSPYSRLRFSYKFYGAHTGRWSGEGVQPQNLPRGVENPSTPLERVSSGLRAAFKGNFVVADLSAIENRVLAWMAQCPAMLSVYERGLDPYIDFASRLFSKPYDQVTKAERTLAKPAVLGCGYMLSGGVEKVDKNGDEFKSGLWGYAEAMGVTLSQAEAAEAVRVFRASYPEVVNMWYGLEDAAIEAVRSGTTKSAYGITISAMPAKILYMVLPGGRRLHYLRPALAPGKFGRAELTYEGKLKGWARRQLYGGLLVENLVQAIARDVLAEGMLRADAAGFKIAGHTHDEIITEGPGSLAKLIECMTLPIDWAPGLPLAAEGWEGQVYRK